MFIKKNNVKKYCSTKVGGISPEYYKQLENNLKKDIDRSIARCLANNRKRLMKRDT